MYVTMHVCECGWTCKDNLSHWPLPSTLSQGLLYTRLQTYIFQGFSRCHFPLVTGHRDYRFLLLIGSMNQNSLILIRFTPSHLLILEAPISNGGEKICNTSFDSRARKQCFRRVLFNVSPLKHPNETKVCISFTCV